MKRREDQIHTRAPKSKLDYADGVYAGGHGHLVISMMATSRVRWATLCRRRGLHVMREYCEHSSDGSRSRCSRPARGLQNP